MTGPSDERIGPNPSGLCQCGCGEPAPVARESNRRLGHVRGQPMRYIRGHSGRKPQPPPPNPSGLCECGCGERTPLARVTERRYGLVQGHPIRFVNGHQNRARQITGEGPNPSGMCLCGCGAPAPIADCSVVALGHVKGKPLSYIRGHQPKHPRRVEPHEPGDYVVDDNGCWIWQKTLNATGYGSGRGALAHRWYYERLVGPIPEGHHLHHICETPACVNPDHLEPLTPAEHKKRHAKAAVP